MNQQQPSSSRSAPGGVWNGKPIPGGENRDRVSHHPPPPSQNEEEKKPKVEYACKLPPSYGQSRGVYEEKPSWVEDEPPPCTATAGDDDDDWSDQVDPTEKERLLKAAQQPFCPLVKAGPNVNFYLYPGEKMEQCPYDKSHPIREAHFLSHLRKCRSNYIKQQKARGKRLEIGVCLHDGRHHVRVDEMEEHAAVCPATLKYRKEVEEINNAPPPTFPQYNPPPVVRMAPPNLTGQTSDKGIIEAEEENWGLAEPVPSFNPVENLAQNGTLFFCPQGLTKSERKDFRENERIRSYLMEQRDKLKREIADPGGQGPTGQGADPNDTLLAKLEEEIQERAEKFKRYVYRTRPSADWMDEDKDDEYE